MSFPTFGNGNGNEKIIPNFREREWEAGIPGNGREREFPLTPGILPIYRDAIYRTRSAGLDILQYIRLTQPLLLIKNELYMNCVDTAFDTLQYVAKPF